MQGRCGERCNAARKVYRRLMDAVDPHLIDQAEATRKSADVTVCLLKRAWHKELLRDIRATGARMKLLSDGDVAGRHLGALRPRRLPGRSAASIDALDRGANGELDQPRHLHRVNDSEDGTPHGTEATSAGSCCGTHAEAA
jgi:hypothetical protein